MSRRLCLLLVIPAAAAANGASRGPSVALVPRALTTAVDPCPERNPERLGRWVPLPAEGAPPAGLVGPRLEVAWTGRRLVLRQEERGAAWDPCRHAWDPLGTDAVQPSRDVPAGAYDAGGGVIVLPGLDRLHSGGHEVFAGATIDLPDGRTLTAPAAGAPPPRILPAVAAAGRALVVFGGVGADTATLGTGTVLDLKANRWRPLPAAGAPSKRYRPFVAVAAGKVFVWGGEDDDGNGVQRPLGDGAIFDPVRHKWKPIALTGAPSPRVCVGHTVLIRSIGRYVLLSGGAVGGAAGRDAAVYVYDLARDHWSALQPPAGVQWWTHAWSAAGGRAILAAAWLECVAVIDPAKPALEAVAVPPGLWRRANVALGWTGSRLIAWGGSRNDPNWKEPDPHHGEQYGFPLPPPQITYADGWSWAPR